MYLALVKRLKKLSPPVPHYAGLETQRSQRYILFSFAAERAANEKQSASGGSMITILQCICIDPKKQLMSENFPKGCRFFLSALSAERKKKLSVLCASNERSEWAVRNQPMNTCGITCCRENGNNIMILIVISKLE
jgi:hypothetical protein